MEESNRQLCQELECYRLSIKKDRLEKKHKRTVTVIIVILTALIIALFLGTVGYVIIFGLSWIDALYNATLILSALDVHEEPMSTGQKLFIIIYALIAVILLLSFANAATQRLADFFVEVD